MFSSPESDEFVEWSRMEKAYWEARYREEMSTRICIDWNWNKEVCERPEGCTRSQPNGGCSVTMGFQRAWKWKTIGEAIRKYSPELVKSITHLNAPKEPEAPIIHDKHPVKVRRPENESHLVLPKVIDVGCGDLIFWRSESLRVAHPLSWHTHGIMRTEEYIGIDISETVITRNRRFNEGWNFIVSPADILKEGLRAPVVFCIDLLFHIMDDTAFIETLKNLCHYSEDLIFIHTWKYDPGLASDGDRIYQKYRSLEAFFDIFLELDFTLIEERLNPNQIGCLYVFKQDGRARYI